MPSIHEVMTGDHRRCDDHFAALESALDAAEIDAATDALEAFSRLTKAHLALEESILFPAFEARTGMRQGPTAVMRQEHDQIRGQIDAVQAALVAGELEDCASGLDALLLLMQQHNLKEENILYPMCDLHLGEAASALVLTLTEELAPEGVV